MTNKKQFVLSAALVVFAGATVVLYVVRSGASDAPVAPAQSTTDVGDTRAVRLDPQSARS